MTANNEIKQLIDRTPFVDTHEHLWEESVRVQALTMGKESPIPPADFGILFSHYTDSDLIVSGMPPADMAKIVGHDLTPKGKWALLAPYYDRIRHTGYGRFVRESVRRLFDEDDLRADNIEAVSDKLRAGVQPGYYRRVLKEAANIEYAQVNSLEGSVFRETALPDLLAQDLSIVALGSGVDVAGVSKALNREVSSLKDWKALIDWCFATYGPRAIAVKDQSAYSRGLDYERVSEKDAAPLFARYLKNSQAVTPEELKAIQDHLFHYCVDKAAEYNLPVKLHTGYFAGYGGMPLHRVRRNAGDICALLQAHLNARFDLFHIDYPYQDEIIALAKHYPNAWVDMCWVWIINPAASVRFVKEFLTAAPANKLFTFGGDVMPVELVPGHAAVARQGLAQAVSELIEEGWLAAAEAEALIERLMRGNAHAFFDYEHALAAWS